MNFGYTDFFNCEWTVKSKYIGIHSKRIFRFGYCVNIRYENFHCSVIVDNTKEDYVLLEKLRKLQKVVHMLCALCTLGFKQDGKVRKLERVHKTALNSSMGIDITTYRIRIGHFGPGRVSMSTGSCDCVHRSFTLFLDRWTPLPTKLDIFNLV